MATVVFGDFEWDDRKAASNLKKHGVSFEEAITALADPRALTAPDLVERDRWITIGTSALLKVLFVVHTENLPRNRVRIITARRLPRRRGESTMKKTDRRKLPEGNLDRYDWAKGRRGAFAKKAAKASELLRILDPELAEEFPDSKSVNDALHALVALDQALPRRKGRRHAAA